MGKFEITNKFQDLLTYPLIVFMYSFFQLEGRKRDGGGGGGGGGRRRRVSRTDNGN